MGQLRFINIWAWCIWAPTYKKQQQNRCVGATCIYGKAEEAEERGVNLVEQIPDKETLAALTGQSLSKVREALCEAIDEQYDMERVWSPGGMLMCGKVTHEFDW